MAFLLFVFWLAFAGAVGMFAHVRRNRFGFGWFLLALVISPLLAGIFVAILKEGEADINPASAGVSIQPSHPITQAESTNFYLGMLIVGAVIVAIPIMAVLASH